MKKILVMTISLLMVAGVAFGEDAVTVPEFEEVTGQLQNRIADLEATVTNLATQINIFAGNLQEQINDLSSGGIHVVDAHGVNIGTLLTFSSNMTVLPPGSNKLLTISLSNGALNMPKVIFTNEADCFARRAGFVVSSNFNKVVLLPDGRWTDITDPTTEPFSSLNGVYYYQMPGGTYCESTTLGVNQQGLRVYLADGTLVPDAYDAPYTQMYSPFHFE